MTGFESVTKAAEEASPEFRARGFSRVIFSAIVVGFMFYIIVIAAVGFVAPWRQLTDAPFMTAVAFEHAVGARWIVSIIMSAALLSLFKVFNGNFIAASRLLFAMARRGLLDDQLATVHPRNQTPSSAVLVTGIATGLCMFLGSAILVPIAEVGSVASATGWFAVCAAFLWTRPRTRDYFDCTARRIGWTCDGYDEVSAIRSRPLLGMGVAGPRNLDSSRVVDRAPACHRA